MNTRAQSIRVILDVLKKYAIKTEEKTIFDGHYEDIQSLFKKENQSNLSDSEDTTSYTDTDDEIQDDIPKELNYETHLALNELSLVVYPNAFECPICFEKCEERQGIILKQCLHHFCRDCLKNTAVLSEDIVDVKCPFVNDDYSCSSTLLEQEIKELLSPEEYQKRLNRTLDFAASKIEYTIRCLKPDCIGMAINEGGVTIFECPTCQSPNCLSCKAIHSGLSCTEYLSRLQMQKDGVNTRKTEELLSDMVKIGNAMYCPQCTAVVEKDSGCDSIKCTMCGTELCWATKGRRWGPNGYGDTSGGCRCKVNGKLCTPYCRNCH